MATVTTPSIPASTVPVVNSTGMQLSVQVTGGTVSNISVNGSTAASGSNVSVPLPPGGSIVLTYSVVPTSWAWSDPEDASFEGGSPNPGPYSQLTDEPGITAHTVGGEPGLGLAEDN